MEADWEVEIGADAPVIDAEWPGLVDLRSNPKRVEEIQEARRFPALAETLIYLNSGDPVPLSAIWTSKCDLWTLEDWDPYEMDAKPEESQFGLGCYIDLLHRDESCFGDLSCVETWVRGYVSHLRQTACCCCRADLVLRRAVNGTLEGFGITAYISACGRDNDAAEEALAAALTAFAGAIVGSSMKR